MQIPRNPMYTHNFPSEITGLNQHIDQQMDSKPVVEAMDILTVINTEARTVLSDVTSSSSGESTDHADDDQLDSVSTRMRRSGRTKKYTRAKTSKHSKQSKSGKHSK